MKKNLFIAVFLVSILLAVLTACSVTNCADGHSWVDGEITKQATCDTIGVMVQKCKVCSVTQEVPVAVLGHKFSAWTADEDGLTHSRVCENDATHVEKSNHTDADADSFCDVCSYELNVLPPICSHTWGQWTDNEDGTCTRVCSLNNDHTETVDHIDSDENELCDNCGADLHICEWLDWESNGDGTHTRVCEFNEDHVETENCSGGVADCYNGAYCDYCYEEYTDALGHLWGEWESNEDGTHGRICSRDPEDEHYDEDYCAYTEAGRTPATCDDAEIITYQCDVCNHTYTEEGNPATGHNIVKMYVVEAGNLYWTETCTNECECSFVDVRNNISSTDYAPVATAEDLKTVLENGFNAVLTEDIELVDGPIEITNEEASLDLNGHNLTSTGIKQSTTTGLMVCDVFIVKGSSAKLTIKGDGTILADPSADALVGVDEDNLSVCVLSALDGAYVAINGGTYHSTGCTTIFARTNSHVIIEDGKFIADDPEYTLDILESEMDECNYTYISVFGGEFVKFNPENHSNDGGYSSKVVTFASHVIYDESTQTYSVEPHNVICAESVYGELNMLAYCDVCGFHVDYKAELEDGDIITGILDLHEYPIVSNEFTLVAVEGEEDTFYILDNYTGKYVTRGEFSDYLSSEKTEDGKWLVKGEYVESESDNGADITYGIFVGIPGEEDYEHCVDLYRFARCNNHQPRIEIAGMESCTDTTTLTLICEGCGLHSVIVEVPGGEHMGSELVSSTPATCESPEILTYYCYDCSVGTYTVEGEPALGHKWEYSDCGDGTHDMICQNDNNHRQNDVCNPKGEYVTQVSATCTVGAYTRYECDKCGGVTTASNSDPLGHDYVWTDNNDGTCTGVCSRNCGEENHTVTQNHIDADKDCACDFCKVEAHVDVELPICVCDNCRIEVHDWVYVDVDGKCKPVCQKNDGSRDCPSDGAVDHIDENNDCKCDRGCGADVHNQAEIVTVVEPTCMADGYTTYYCGNCEQSYTGNIITRVPCVPAYEDMGDGTCLEVCFWGCPKYPVNLPEDHVDNDNDCKCDKCGAVEHTLLRSDVVATCEGSGYTLFACKNCDVSEKINEVEPLGHSYIISNTGNGTHRWTCENDNSHIIDEECDDDITIIAPTCMEGGHTEHYCGKCLNTYMTDITDRVDCVEIWKDCGNGSCTVACKYGCKYPDADGPSPHEDNDDDCKCDRCGGEIHNYEAIVTEPTCMAKGFTTYTCSNCETSYTGNEVDMVDHDLTKWADLGNGNCELICRFEGCVKYPITDFGPHSDANNDVLCDRCGASMLVSTELSISFATKDDRVSQTAGEQVWQANGVKLTNNKASSTNNVADYANPVRFYKNSTVTIEFSGMTKIVFDCAGVGADYIKGIANSLASVGGSVENVDGIITLSLDQSVDSITFTLTAQGRCNSITVTVLRCPGEHLDADTNEVCDNCGADLHVHEYTEIIFDATCTEDGYTDFVCQCGHSYIVAGNSATGHTYVYTNNNGKCLETCENCDHSKELTHVDDNADGECDKCHAEVTAEDTQKTPTPLTLSFATKDDRVSQTAGQQVWQANGITLTNNRGSGNGTSDIVDSSKPVKFYANSQIIIECEGMTKIVFDCNTPSYATALQTSLKNAGYEATVSSDKVTIVFDEPVDELTFKMSAQVRMDSMTVTAMR